MEVGTKLPETLRVVSESGSKLICTFFAEDEEHKVTIDKKQSFGPTRIQTGKNTLLEKDSDDFKWRLTTTVLEIRQLTKVRILAHFRMVSLISKSTFQGRDCGFPFPCGPRLEGHRSGLVLERVRLG
jgi:hypothetical protein